MAGGRDGFLNELTGDFVKHLRSHSPIAAVVGGSGTDARIFCEAARQGVAAPYIVYTQSMGNSEKHLAGLDGCESMVVHVYCYAENQPASRSLANHVRDRMLPTQAIVADGTKLYVCNGGISDTGVEYDQASGDRKRFWTRLVLRMVIGN